MEHTHACTYMRAHTHTSSTCQGFSSFFLFSAVSFLHLFWCLPSTSFYFHPDSLYKQFTMWLHPFFKWMIVKNTRKTPHVSHFPYMTKCFTYYRWKQTIPKDPHTFMSNQLVIGYLSASKQYIFLSQFLLAGYILWLQKKINHFIIYP